MRSIILPALVALIVVSATSASAQDRRAGPAAHAPPAGIAPSRGARADRPFNSGRNAYRSRTGRTTSESYGYRAYYSSNDGYRRAYYGGYGYRPSYYRSYGYAPAASRSNDFCDW
jgi:hypothetical protein